MDDNLLLIVVGSTVVFIAVVVWKVLWFLKRVQRDEQVAEDDHQR